MKKIFIDPKLGIREQAERLANIEARVKKFKVGSSRWENAVHKYVDDRIRNSSTPFLKPNPKNPFIPNPHKPRINEKLWDEFELLKIGKIFSNKQDLDTFRACVTTLTGLVLKNMGLKTKSQGSDFLFKSNSNPKEILEVYKNRYIRLFIAIQICVSLMPVFLNKKSDIDFYLKSAFGNAFENVDMIKVLKNKSTFQKFVKACQAQAEKIVSSESLISKIKKS